MEKKAGFYLGANTPNGFVSLFNELYNPYEDWLVYIVKGGPGTGKSGMMKKVADSMEERNISAERIYCSSDPSSLDAVIFPELRACIADGTAPHVIEPKFPGIVEEIINLGEFWDSEKLRKNAETIRSISMKNASFHKRASKFLSAASIFKSDTSGIISEYLNIEKAENFATRFSSRMFPAIYGKVGCERKRFLSAVTPEGVVGRFESINLMCDTVIEIEDEYELVSGILLKQLRTSAIGKGLDIITCPCPMSKEGKIDHIIIPQLRFAICTSNRHHQLPFEPTQRIHAVRFINAQGLKKNKKRLSFNAKAYDELLDEAVGLLARAKETHDTLEGYYIDAMDFEKVNKAAQKITARLCDRAEI